MHILFLNPNVPQDIGYESGRDFVTMAESHQRHCDIATELGHDVEFGYLSQGREKYDHPKFGHQVHGFPVSFKLPYMEISVPLLRYIWKEGFDLIYVNTIYSHRLLPILLTIRATGTPVVLHHHGDVETAYRFQLQRKMLQMILSSAEYRLFCVNQKAVDQLREAGFGRVERLAFGINTDLFTRIPISEARSTVDFEDDAIHILFVGRIKYIKGIFQLVEAFERLTEEYDNLRLHLIYGGAKEETMDKLRRQVEESRLTNSIDFIGKVDRHDLPAYYNAADFCVFPSIREGFGMVPAEAMSCGAPIIATETHVDAGHSLEHRQNALVANSGSTESLLEQMQVLLDDPELRESIGRNARRTIESKYTWESIQNKLDNVFTELSDRD